MVNGKDAQQITRDPSSALSGDQRCASKHRENLRSSESLIVVSFPKML